jgi:predicted permease
LTSILGVAVNILGPVFLIIGLVLLLNRRFSLDVRTVSRIVLYLFSPCLMFNTIAKTELRIEELGLIVAMAVGSSLIMTLIGWGLARLFRFGHTLESSFLLSIAIANAGNYGMPVNEFAFGPPGLERAVLFNVAMNVVASTLGIYLASRGSASVRRSLANILMLPMIYAIVLGLLFNVQQWALPLPLQRVVDLLSQATVPCMLLVLGLQLSRASLKGKGGPLVLAIFARLAIAPVVAFALSGWLGLTGTTRLVAIVETSMPAAVVSTLLAQEFGSDAEFVSSVTLGSTLASLVSLSILLAILL